MMADFGIRFFLCNLVICVIIVFLLMARQALRHVLTSRMQFHLWFLLLGLLSVPFLPFRPASFVQALAWPGAWKHAVSPDSGAAVKGTLNPDLSGAVNQISDFALSVSRETPSVIGLILCVIWLAGVLAMVLFATVSISRFHAVKKSALPLQNRAVRILYHNCLKEAHIKKNIPVYSTAFLKSPVIVGLCKPCIYLPIHLISEFNAADMRYMLLHELQHYRHKDALANFFMNLFGVLYWCNPFVWYALKEMQSDREIACDTSVLKLLDERDYEDYGRTLINFAEKISRTPFPFTAGISGNRKQIRQRIIHISTYKKPSVFKKLQGAAAFAAMSALLFGLAPMLSTCAAEQSRYAWTVPSDKIFTIDLSARFRGYEGSFVLYDLKSDTWKIYDLERATVRTSPNSTYKIYGALFGLEEGVIAPEDSFMAWDGTEHPFEAWNRNQDLSSAMQASVNWYFEEIDRRIGPSAIQNYIRDIGYGNEHAAAGRTPCWMQGTLKISPVEQVELLTALYNNRLGFAPEHVDAVKHSICLFSSEEKTLYGKTGTGCVDGQNVNGWFVGFLETDDHTCFFAANIQNDSDADGSRAAEITKAVLADLDLWK